MNTYKHSLLVALALAFVMTSPLRAAIINNWVNWTQPTFSSTASTAPLSGWWGSSYSYAPSVSGTLAIPNSTNSVNVTLTGEAVGSGGASVFTANAPDTWAYWGGNPSAFISSNVPSLPSTDTRIGLAGWGSASQTLTFSQPVSNIVMIIATLGQPGDSATWTFTQPFVILSDGFTANGSAPFSVSGNNTQLTGQEANGVIQFVGTFTEFTWTVSEPEMYAAWNIAATSADPPPFPSAVPEPGTWAAAALLAGGAAFMRWRKRRNEAA